MGIASDITRIQGAKQDLKTAINAKGGSLTTELIDDYAAAVDALSIGEVVVEEKDVNFYDYDGTLVYSYTIAEANALSALPAGPDHSGDDVPLTFYGWNFTLAEVNAAVGLIIIGATYYTTDEKTHFILRINAATGGDIPFEIAKTVATDTLNIDFGNGETQSNSSDTSVTFTPATPLAIGNHDVKIWLSAGYTGKYIIGINTLMRCFLGSEQRKQDALIHVHIGYGGYGGTSSYSYNDCQCLETISLWGDVYPLPSSVGQFKNCRSLKAIVIPRATTNATKDRLAACMSLEILSLPFTQGYFSDYAYNVNGRIQKLSIKSTSNFGNYCFANMKSVLIWDFSHYTVVPTCTNASFSNAYTAKSVFKIPTALFAIWSTATNWSVLAPYMVAV